MDSLAVLFLYTVIVKCRPQIMERHAQIADTALSILVSLVIAYVMIAV